MASVPRSRRPTEPRSSGKIVRARRPAGARTPYDRPKLPNSGPQNPNWLARFVFPPTRLIATGAGKLLSSVFGPESSSSSSSSSGGDSSSEDDVDDNNNDDDISSQRAEGLEKNGTSETVKFFRKEPLPTVGSSETKCLIEQLLLRETYSREECDRLTSIIKSRVVDYPVTDDTENGRQGEVSSRIVCSDIEAPALCGTAVGEAKKWLEEKKLGSNSKSELGHGTPRLSSVELSRATDGEVGSPVDMAKSYMRARPAWASPSTKHIEFESTSPVGIPPLFKEETPYSIGGNSTSSSKLKRDSPTTGSWNIQEEIRKVRSKATEEMLRTLPSTKIDWSSFGLDYKRSQNSLAMDRLETGMGDKTYYSTKSVDVSSNLASLSAPSVLEMTQAGMQNEVTPPNPADFISGHNQDVEDIRSIKGKDLADGSEDMLNFGRRLHSSEVIKTVSYSDTSAVDGFKDTNGTDHQLSSIEGTTQDSRLHDGNFPTSDNAAGMGVACTANGFPTPGSSLPARLDTEQDAKAAKPADEEQNSVSSSHNKITTTANVETCELLSEASMEIPNVNETESVANGSQNSSSMHGEELSQDLTQPKRGLSLAGKNSSIVEEKQGRKPSSRPNRRGRGRGK